MLAPRAPDLSSHHSISVAASPEHCFRCVRHLDFGRSPAMRALLVARGIGRMRTIDAAVAAGFVVMVDEPPRSLALAFVGRPWQLRGGVQRLDRAGVLGFDRAGFVKVLWRFDVEPAASTTTVSTTTEIWATDSTALQRFRRYWAIVGPFSAALRRSLLRTVEVCAEGGSRPR